MTVCDTFVKPAMSAISSFPATQPVSSGGSQQAALQQAKRVANQAEAAAQTLEAQAANAQSTASSAQNYAQSLTIQAGEAQLNVGWTQQNLAAVETAGQLNTQLSSIINNVVDVKQSKQPPTTAPLPALPVINTQGQITGKIINISA
jgi:hypothetical protein